MQYQYAYSAGHGLSRNKVGNRANGAHHSQAISLIPNCGGIVGKGKDQHLRWHPNRQASSQQGAHGSLDFVLEVDV